MGGRAGELVFTDPPYNVPIDGHVCGLGAVRHREFAMASGEMSPDEFTAFLATALGHAAARLPRRRDPFVCMDWRHMGELLAAGETVFSELKNLCVWNKTNGGMGRSTAPSTSWCSCSRSAPAPHINNFGLGGSGRYRTNVWDYAGRQHADSAGAWRSWPCTRPSSRWRWSPMPSGTARSAASIVLDSFGGSGTTLIAAEKTGRRARLIELDPLYCDVIVRRYEAYTGKRATLAATGEAFEDRERDHLAAGPRLHRWRRQRNGGRHRNASLRSRRIDAKRRSGRQMQSSPCCCAKGDKTAPRQVGKEAEGVGVNGGCGRRQRAGSGQSMLARLASFRHAP